MPAPVSLCPTSAPAFRAVSPDCPGDQGVSVVKRLVIALAVAVGCGGGDPVQQGDDDPTETDVDVDGWSVEDGDCDDDRADVHPEAPDPCDGFDQNCDGVRDEAFDVDGDNWTTCSGD